MIKKHTVLNDLHQIISEKLHTGEKDFNSGLGLKETIDSLLETYNNNKTLVNFLNPYKERLKTTREELLVEDFINNFKIYADNFPELSEPYNKIRLKLNENIDNVRITQLFENISDTALKNNLKEDVLNYAYDKSFENKINLLQKLNEASPFDPGAGTMYNYIYPILPKSHPDMVMSGSNTLNENQKINPGNIDENKIFEGVDNYINKRIKETKDNKLAENFSGYKNIDNNIKLYDTLKKLYASKFADNNLNAILEKYNTALNQGYSEEMLYDNFINEMKTNFTYINDVNEEVSQMIDRTKDKTSNIGLTKLMEIMSSNGEYYYIVPLIEENVVSFEKNPSADNKNILISQLRTFDACPMIREMISIIESGYNSIDNYTVNESDYKKLVKNNIHIENVYSPVQYINENECIFNVDGTYFVKRGNSIAKLSQNSFSNLSEQFIKLTNFINSPCVSINEDNTITFIPNNEKPIIIKPNTKGGAIADINGNIETSESMKNSSVMFMKYNNFDKECYDTASFLTENFNKIAKLDFINKISLNENEVLLFKLKNNMFIQTNNISEGRIFYRNVKPIQASNIINEIFGVNISNLFDSLIPAKNKIENELLEIKNSYETRLSKLNERKTNLLNSMQYASEDDMIAIKKAMKNIDKDILESNKEYLKFQKNVKNLNEGKKTNNDKVSENEDEPTEDTGGEDNADEVSADTMNEDGSDEDDLFGSDEDKFFSEDDFTGSDENEEYTSSDGDILTEPIENDGSDDDFEIDPFNNKTNLENEVPDDSYNTQNADDFQKDETGLETTDKEDDPFNPEDNEEDTDQISNTEDNEPDGENKADAEKDANCFYPDFKIVKIDFDENVFSGTIRPTGKVIVVIPWIDAEGNVESKTRSIDFYLKMINGEKGVVFDTEGMSIELYTAIRNYIINSENFKNFSKEDINSNKEKPSSNSENTLQDNIETSPDDTEGDDIETPESTETEPEDNAGGETTDISSGVETDNDDVFDSGSDEVTTITMHDNIAPHGIEFPAYKDGDTEIEQKAPQKNDIDTIPESKILDIKATYENNGKEFNSSMINESKKNANPKKDEAGVSDAELNLFGDINESFDDEKFSDEEDDGSSEDELIDTRKNVDPIALAKDILLAYDKDTFPEINDYDVDGEDVSSIDFVLGSSPFTAFTYKDKFYIADREDFNNLNSKEDFDDFTTENSEDVSETENPKDVEDEIVNFIKKITGDDFDIQEIPDDEEKKELKDPENIEDEKTEDMDENARVHLKKK